MTEIYTFEFEKTQDEIVDVVTKFNENIGEILVDIVELQEAPYGTEAKLSVTGDTMADIDVTLFELSDGQDIYYKS